MMFMPMMFMLDCEGLQSTYRSWHAHGACNVVQEQPSKRQRTEAAVQEQESPDRCPTAGMPGSLEESCPPGDGTAVVEEGAASIGHRSTDSETANISSGAGGKHADSALPNQPHVESLTKEDAPSGYLAKGDEAVAAAGMEFQCHKILEGSAMEAAEEDLPNAWEALGADPPLEAEPAAGFPASMPGMESLAAEEEGAEMEGAVHPTTLEWLRDVAEDDARQYLMGVMGASWAFP